MFSKADKNFFLDTILFIIAGVCLLSGLFLFFKPTILLSLFTGINIKVLHEWIGLLFTLLLLVHWILHIDWVRLMTKSIRSTKSKSIIALSMVLLSIIICAIILQLAPAPKMPNNTKGTPPTQQQ